MKKTYTKKHITEAIEYWKKQLKKLNENIDGLPIEFQNFLADNGGHCSIKEYNRQDYLIKVKNIKAKIDVDNYNACDVIGIICDKYMFEIELPGSVDRAVGEAYSLFADLCNKSGIDDDIKIEFVFPIHSNYAGYN